METSFAYLIATVFILTYLLPGIIAIKRKHGSANTLVFLNIGFGWFPIIWIVTLIWAIRGKTRDEVENVAAV